MPRRDYSRRERNRERLRAICVLLVCCLLAAGTAYGLILVNEWMLR